MSLCTEENSMGITLSKIYTRGGDQGMTSLIGGERVSKSDAKVEAYGILDELNSFLGMLRAEISQIDRDPPLRDTEVDLHRLQNRLY